MLAVLLKIIVCWWCEHLALILPPSSLPPYCSRITFQSRFFNNGYGGCCVIFGNKRVNINNFGLDSRYTRPEPASRPVTRLLMRYCPRRPIVVELEFWIHNNDWPMKITASVDRLANKASNISSVPASFVVEAGGCRIHRSGGETDGRNPLPVSRRNW